MKVVILAGGLGTRISEESTNKPKPMINIGNYPILWHIMKYFSAFGHNDFIICCGYKSYVIKDYFVNFHLHSSDISLSLNDPSNIKIHDSISEPWNVSLIDTGELTLTGGRLKRIYSFVKDEPYFFMTYGDGLSNVNLDKLENFHKEHKKLSTVTAVQPPARFGYVNLDQNHEVTSFEEKNPMLEKYINGGFFVLDPECLKLINGDNVSWEREPMEHLSKNRQMVAFKHNDFWIPMDTMRDKSLLEDLWHKGNAPWKIW